MKWDFRHLIRRGGDRPGRGWGLRVRFSLPPPKPATPLPPTEADEHWLEPGWEPPPGSADAWKQAD